MAHEQPGGARAAAHELNVRIGGRIRLARGLARLSIQALAATLGWPATRLAAYEAGLDLLQASDLKAVADALRLPVAWFYGPAGDGLPAAEQRARARQAEVLDGLDGALSDRGEAERDALIARTAQFADNLDHARTTMVGDLSETTAQDAAAPPAMEAAPPVASQPPARRRVLVVDDAPDVLVTTGAFVEAAGFEAVRARDADVALAILASGERVDAIVTDYAMPTLSGVDLLLQAAQVRPGIPAMIITGFADVTGLAELPTGIEVLHKPFRRAQFTAMLDAMLGDAPQPVIKVADKVVGAVPA